MITKNQLKLINSLEQKKQRKLTGTFLVQGEKNVSELFSSHFKIETIFATPNYIKANALKLDKINTVEATDLELKKAGTLLSNNSVIAIVQTCEMLIPTIDSNETILVLDQIKDPGNLGTIIRVADWYGIENIVCSPECADFYNPKVIAATMGSFTRVKLSITSLPEYLSLQNAPIYGAFLGGENIHKANLIKNSFIVMGSESHGISEDVSKCISNKITIPNFGNAESLNVAMATGIILDNFMR